MEINWNEATRVVNNISIDEEKLEFQNPKDGGWYKLRDYWNVTLKNAYSLRLVKKDQPNLPLRNRKESS